MRELYDKLAPQFRLGELTLQRPNLAFITVAREQLRPLLLHLRDREGFTHLVLLTAVDWIEDDQFQLTYLLSDRTPGPLPPPTSANCARCSASISPAAPA